MPKNWEASRAAKYLVCAPQACSARWFKFGKKKSRATPPRLSWVHPPAE